MITADDSDIESLLEKFDALPADVIDSLVAQTQELTALLRQTIDENLSGGILETRTGALKDSITDEQQAGDAEINVVVAVSDEVPYAAILEYGGETKAHIIEAINAKALAFSLGGKDSFFKQVNHPGSHIPTFAYMQTSLATVQDDITDGLTDAVIQPLEDTL